VLEDGDAVGVGEEDLGLGIGVEVGDLRVRGLKLGSL
jgi:hypothetical protein